MRGRIADRQDIKYYWDRYEVAYDKDSNIFYDTQQDLLHDSDGDCLGTPNEYFEDPSMHIFRYKDKSICDDYRKRHTRRRRSMGPSKFREDRWEPNEHEQMYESDGIINFLVLGMMSKCSKTDNGGSHVKTTWKDQQPCHFAIRSVEGNRCMYWCGSLDGHCSCHDAYAHRTRSRSFRRSDLIQRREADEIKSNPKHHFDQAERITVDHAQDLYANGHLTECINVKYAETLFYYKAWDIFLNRYGRFLREMSEYRRKHDADYRTVAKEWKKNLDVAR